MILTNLLANFSEDDTIILLTCPQNAANEAQVAWYWYC
jgi:hypothetical protein